MDQGLQHIEALKYFVPLFCYLLIELARVRSRERLARRKLEAEERGQQEEHQTMRHSMTKLAQSPLSAGGCTASDAPLTADAAQQLVLTDLRNEMRALRARLDTCLAMQAASLQIMARVMAQAQPEEVGYHPPKEQLALPAEIRYSSGAAGRDIDSAMN